MTPLLTVRLATARGWTLSFGVFILIGAYGCDRAQPSELPSAKKIQPAPALHIQPAWTSSDSQSPVSLNVPEGWTKIEPHAINPQAQLALHHAKTKQTVAVVWAKNRYEGTGIAELTRFKHEALEHLRGHIPAIQLKDTAQGQVGDQLALILSARALVEQKPVLYAMLYSLNETHQIQLVSLSESSDEVAHMRAFKQLQQNMQWKTKP